MICKFCLKECKNKMSLSQHQLRCPSNPERLEVKHPRGMLGKKGSNQYIKAKELGLPAPAISEKERARRSQLASSIEWTPEKRARHSESMKKAVKEHASSYSINNVSGRVKNVTYRGRTLKGSWELTFAKWLDHHGVIWDSEVKSFPYSWNGRTHQYFPDFFIPGFEVYVEVKGFKRDRDLAKWSAFPEPLVIVDKTVIFRLDTYTSVAQLVEQRLYTP